MLDVLLLNLPLELPEAARELRVKALLDIVANLHVGCPPLYVVLVGGLQVIQWITHL